MNSVVTEHKINIQKCIAFLHTNNELPEKVFKKKILLQLHQKYNHRSERLVFRKL